MFEITFHKRLYSEGIWLQLKINGVALHFFGLYIHFKKNRLEPDCGFISHNFSCGILVDREDLSLDIMNNWSEEYVGNGHCKIKVLS